MDISPGKTDKLCRIFTKMIDFFMLFLQFVNIWYRKIFWKKLEALCKRDLQTPLFLLP